MTNDERRMTDDERRTTSALHSSFVLHPSSEVHFSRVAPIVGPALRQARVALIGLPVGAPIVAYLAACGVGRWLWCAGLAQPAADPAAALRRQLTAQHGSALALDAICLPPGAWAAALQASPPDLLIAVGDAGVRAFALDLARAARVPALLVAPPTASWLCQAVTVFPDDDSQSVVDTSSTFTRQAGGLEGRGASRDLFTRWSGQRSYPDQRVKAGSGRQSLSESRYKSPDIYNLQLWDWATSAPLCAGLARAILLRATPFRRADLAELWASGARIMTLGRAHPFDVAWFAPQQSAICDPQPAIFQTPPARRGCLLIAGLGSLGSVAATLLAGHVEALVLADPDIVDAANPARQAYPLATVGQPKARALRELLADAAGPVVAVERALAGESEVAALVERYGITAGLVVTGGGADFAIARALRRCGIPHIVGRCYPRARYWEAILVDGRRGPALSDLRGRLELGPAPAPTPEQLAAYSDAGALEAEPATLVESGWAAAWMARLTAQLLAPPGLRERWLLELLAAGQTCLIGGVGVERTPAGAAYAIEAPGQVRAWGREALSLPQGV